MENMSEKLYAIQLKESSYIIITNLKCVDCFENQNYCKISFIIEIDNIEEWKKISKTIINGNCMYK
jgi:hypothetical protein